MKRPIWTRKRRAKGGKRPDLGISLKSRWEANYARYLSHLQAKGKIVGWAYEPKEFAFEQIQRGVRFYKPDFRVDLPDGTHFYVEIKGYMDAKSRVALKRMAKFYPDIRVRVVDAKEYADIERVYRYLLPNWESPE